MNGPLPNGWIECKIGDVTTVVAGGTPKTTDESNFTDSNGIPWLTPADLSGYNEMYIGSGKRFLSKKGLETSSATLMPSGTVLYTSRAPIGYVAIAENEISTNQGFKSFVPEKGIYNKFIYYYLKGAKKIAESLASGTTFLELSGNKAANIPLRLPPFSEQKRIADKLDSLLASVDACKSRLDKVPEILKRFRQSVIADATSGKLTEDWRSFKKIRSDRPAAAKIREERELWWAETKKSPYVEPKKLAKSDKNYNLPTAWEWLRAEEACQFITKGTTPKKDKMLSGNGPIPFIKVYNLTLNGKLDFTVDPTFISEETNENDLKRSIVLPGDVLMNIVGPPLGKVSIVPESHPVWNINQAIAIFRTMPSLINKYLAFVLLQSRMLEFAVRESKATAGQSNLTLQICRDFPLPIPPVAEQKEIVRRVGSLFSVADQLETKLAIAKKRVDNLTASILSKAFKGELVPQDLNDEPAEKLLERIRADRKLMAASKKKGRTSKKKSGRGKKTKSAKVVASEEPEPSPPQSASTKKTPQKIMVKKTVSKWAVCWKNLNRSIK